MDLNEMDKAEAGKPLPEPTQPKAAKPGRAKQPDPTTPPGPGQGPADQARDRKLRPESTR